MNNPYSPPHGPRDPADAQSTVWFTWPRFWLGLVVVGVVSVFLSLAMGDAVWQGRFRLGIVVDPADALKGTTPRFGYIWTGTGALDPCIPFAFVVDREEKNPIVHNANTFEISIPRDGRTRFIGPFGYEVSRWQPKWLVLEWIDANDEIRRQAFEIPQGSGPRTMTVVLGE